MENFINIGLMKNPTNWVVVILMWMLGTLLLHYVTMHFSGNPEKPQGSN